MFICHLFIFFGAVSDKVFHPFSTRLSVFFRTGCWRTWIEQKMEEGENLLYAWPGNSFSLALEHWGSLFLDLWTCTPDLYRHLPHCVWVFGLSLGLVSSVLPILLAFRWNYTLSFPCSLACKRQIAGFNFHNEVRCLCKSSCYMFPDISCWFFFSGES